MNDRIRMARKRAGLTQTELGDKAGVTPQAVQQWESPEGTSPRGKRLDAISTALNVPAQWLQFGGNIATNPRPIMAFCDNDPLKDDEIVVSRLHLKLSAGTGKLMWEIDDNGTPNRFRKSWCEKKGYTPEKLVTVVVEGDSMSPTVPDGASVTINTGALNIRNGKMHAIDYFGEFYIKRLFRLPDGSVIMQSDNPDKSQYPDWNIAQDNLNSLNLLGSIANISYDAD